MRAPSTYRRKADAGSTGAVTAFDPARLGTPESRWASAFAAAAPLSLPASALLVVSPHPDDEVLGAGGLICSAARAGHSVSLLSVTNGEAAFSDWKGLDGIRRREVREAMNILAPSNITAQYLNIPDGQVARHRVSLFDAIDGSLSPDALLVAPYERDGHPDHEAVGEVCCDLARLRNVRVWRYPIWTWHHGTPEHFIGQKIGRFLFDGATRRTKVRALRRFASQLRPPGREPVVPDHVLPYFTRPYELFLI